MLIHDHNQWPQQVTASDPLPSRRLEAPTVRFNCAAQSQFQPRDVQHNSHQRRHLAVTVKLGHQPVRIIRWKIRGLPTMMLTERHTSITDGARNQSRNAPLGSGHAGCGTSVHSRSARSSASAPSGTPQCNDDCPKGPNGQRASWQRLGRVRALLLRAQNAHVTPSKPHLEVRAHWSQRAIDRRLLEETCYCSKL
jgi:hypothetical protein